MDDVKSLLSDLNKVLVGDLRERAERIIGELSQEKVVTGSVHGGVLTLDEIPLGIEVKVRDYDVEGDGLSGEDILQDEDGRYVELVWSNDGEG